MDTNGHAQACVAIATAILNGDFASSTAMVDELDPLDVHGVIAGLVGLLGKVMDWRRMETGHGDSQSCPGCDVYWGEV